MRTSFSQSTLFWTCPRTWHNKYILDLPREESLEFANRGTIVHKCMETYYPKKTYSIKEIKSLFDHMWYNDYHMDETFLANKYDESWGMVVNGINLNLDISEVELELAFDDVKGYIDGVVYDKSTKTWKVFFLDWKTSTRAHQNEFEYIMQLKYYCYLYFRKFNILPSKVMVVYLKYTGDFAFLTVTPTMQDVKNAETFHKKTLEKMKYFIDNPDKIPDYNMNYEWSPYKHLWKVPSDKFIVNLQLSGNYIYFKNDLPIVVLQQIKKKFSYNKLIQFKIKDVLIKKQKPVCLYNEKYKRLNIGFLESLKKTLKDYAQIKNLKLCLNINDRRYFNNKKIEMPLNLLSGKKLRDYQNRAVWCYLDGPEMSMLESATGSGKSLIISDIIREIAKTTLIVVHTKKLMYQLKETLSEELGLEIGQIGDGKKIIKDITVATIQTLSRNFEQFQDYLSTIYFFVCDEAHHIASKSYTDLCHNLKNTKRRLSVTATAHRNDEHGMMLEANSGKVIFTLPTKDLIEDKYLMDPDIFFIRYKNTDKELQEMKNNSKTGLINETPKYHLYYDNFIVNNKVRNNKIIELCDKNKGKKILILVKIKKHIKIIEELLPESKSFDGKTAHNKREEIFNEFKYGDLNILISTVSIFSEGVDIPRLNIIINVSCNKGDIRSIQTLGRVLRKHIEKDSAIYYDFYDVDGIFYGATKSRIHAFKKEGHNVAIV